MLRTLIVGLGQAGRTLHLPVLNRLRAAESNSTWFSPEPIVTFDPRASVPPDEPGSPLVAKSLAEARALLDPAKTVVHMCTPPMARTEVLRQLAELGFVNVLVEKPLATDRQNLERLLHVRDTWNLELMVVGHWLDSTLTHRLTKLVYSGELGELRGIRAVQRKPRYTRTLTSDGHPSAFDVEVPHSLGVALRLAGDATVVEADSADMHVDGAVIPGMGTARVVLQHDHGVRTEIVSELTAVLRERSITLDFDHGQARGHYPVSRDDDYASLTVSVEDQEHTSVFHDDSLASFLLRTYRRFSAGNPPDPDFDLNVQIVSLLSDAKHLSGASGRGRLLSSGKSVGHVA